MNLVFVLTLLLSTGLGLGNEVFSEETKSAFDFAFDFPNLENTSSFNVMDYGAVGNGQADDSQAFNNAWKAVCSANVSAGNATLVVPQGKTFLITPLVFEGPCLSKNIHFQLGGTLIAPPSTSWGNEQVDYWIKFSGVENLTLDGNGTIDGQGSDWWKPCMKPAYFGGFFNCHSRPDALYFHNCNGLQLKGLTHLDSPKIHISINSCKNVVVSDLHITASEDSPNTDGIDISNSSNVLIQDSYIGTGDDCVAINGGSSFINIDRVDCGPGHGISIGSLGDGDYDTVEEVHVTNCNLSNTQNGVRIKTFQGSSGYARNISFEHILFNNVKNSIIINQFYEDKGKLRSYGRLRKAEAIQLSDVTYSDLHGTSASEQAIVLDCNNLVGCSNIVMSNIDITSSRGGPNIQGMCNNAHGTAIDVQPKVPCLS